MTKLQKILQLPCVGFLFLAGISTVQSQDNLNFSYDQAGNQIGYQFALSTNKSTEEEEETIEEKAVSEKQQLENQFSVAPNPTNGEVVLQWKPEIAERITTIQVVSLLNSERQPVSKTTGNSVSLDLSTKPPGLYLVIFYLDHPEITSIQKKLIKM